MEITVKNINEFVVEVKVEENGSSIDCGLFSKFEQKNLAYHLVVVAERLLSGQSDCAIQREILSIISENL